MGGIFTKESLERLKEKLDLSELLSSYLDVKRMGAVHKALCPFHEEKTPSFMVKSGSSHYHCFGCGAHGDAIQFLMQHLHLSFTEAVELLAERYHVVLDKVEKEDKPHVDKFLLKEALSQASLFYHCYLLHTKEGEEALTYLLKRRMSLSFIKRFEIGLAPKSSGLLRKVMKEKGVREDILREAGLFSKEKEEDFFRERITFPIKDRSGFIIGFSARKYREETFGGKYINTYETPLFKKSRILFGLNTSFARIAKEKKAFIVEGQIDCLRMIEEGVDLTVASLGTAFGEEHVRELEKLGVREVCLLFDGDDAGESASSKVGDLFQKKGIDVKIFPMPPKMDPDSFLQKMGKEALLAALEKSVDYLTFQVRFLAKSYDITTPAGKNELVTTMAKQIRQWLEPVMVHESLKKLSKLTQVPEEMIGIEKPQFVRMKNTSFSVDPNKVLEFDLLRWLILLGEEKQEVVEVVAKYLQPHHFWVAVARKLFEAYMKAYHEKKDRDLLTLLIEVDEKEGPEYLEEILSKKINKEKYQKHLNETLQKLLDRNWMQKREEIKIKIHSGSLAEEKVLELMKEFDELKKNRVVL